MATDVRVKLGDYTILRVSRPGGPAAARYDVVRPDGSFCCHAVVWPDVERAIDADVWAKEAERQKLN